MKRVHGGATARGTSLNLVRISEVWYQDVAEKIGSSDFDDTEGPGVYKLILYLEDGRMELFFESLSDCKKWSKGLSMMLSQRDSEKLKKDVRMGSTGKLLKYGISGKVLRGDYFK